MPEDEFDDENDLFLLLQFYFLLLTFPYVLFFTCQESFVFMR